MQIFTDVFSLKHAISWWKNLFVSLRYGRNEGSRAVESEDLAKEEGKYGFLAGVNVAFEEGVGRR